MCAVGGFVHSVSFFQQLKQFFNRDTRVRWAPQSEDLPHQYTKRPPEENQNKMRGKVLIIKIHIYISGHVCTLCCSLGIGIKAKIWNLNLNLHVTLVCVDSVKQGFWCHPLYRQSSLQSGHGNVRAPFFLLSHCKSFFFSCLPFPPNNPPPPPSSPPLFYN